MDKTIYSNLFKTTHNAFSLKQVYDNTFDIMANPCEIKPIETTEDPNFNIMGAWNSVGQSFANVDNNIYNSINDLYNSDEGFKKIIDEKINN